MPIVEKVEKVGTKKFTLDNYVNQGRAPAFTFNTLVDHQENESGSECQDSIANRVPGHYADELTS